MKKLILIKLGGSLITNKSKPFSEDLTAIKRLAKEIHQAQKISGRFLILGHGGGSYPHVPATKYKTAEGIINRKSYKGIAVVQDAAARLNRIVIKELIDAGENAVTLNPSSLMVTQNGEIKKAFLEPLLKLLEFEMLPVVYGDVGLDLKKGCCILSTERILNYLAKKLIKLYQVEKIIHCGKTDGVYDKKGRTVQIIKPAQFRQLRSCLNGSDGFDVTGGMIHKVEEALKLAKLEIETMIINGKVRGNLKRAILGQKVKGTAIRQ